MAEKEKGRFLHHEQCPSCNKKNLARYSDNGAHCFTQGCDYYERADGSPVETKAFERTQKALEVTGVYASLPDRKISKAIMEKLGITVETNQKGEIVKHHYPWTDDNGEAVASQVRVVETKDFYSTGDTINPNLQLFNQSNCRGSGKYITVTEGPLDAAAVLEMFNGRYDVVSVRNGADSVVRELKAQLEFLEGYDHVILCLDNDKAGIGAMKEAREIFSPEKVKVVSLPMKDAGDMLREGKVREFTQCWWDAKTYQPSGIVQVSETWAEVLRYRDTPSIPTPWKGLNDMLLGLRTQEIVVWAAPTGVGKSQTQRELQDFIIKTTKDRVGCLMLEESIAKTTLGWMSFHAGRPLHKELSTISEEELKGYWEMTTAGDRFVLLDHQGWQNNLETLKNRIRYMKHTMGCRWVFLDHLHIALSSISGASGDWSGIDELMTDLRSLVHELDIGLQLVSHVSGDMKLRGSQGIAQLADAVVFLDRDKHHEDPEVANTTKVIVDKNRFVGDTGTACYLRYDKSTGRMTECPKPDGMTDHDEF